MILADRLPAGPPGRAHDNLLERPMNPPDRASPAFSASPPRDRNAATFGPEAA
jgi:hypothetical protein